MKKLTTALVLAAMLCALTGCSPSPTAITVNGRKVDVSEYAFYLNYNRTTSGEDDSAIIYDQQATDDASLLAIKQIMTNELVMLKCKQFDLELSDKQKDTLAEGKQSLIDALGGKAEYVKYLEQSCLTDRAYDKFQRNSIYYEMLYDVVAQTSIEHYTDEVLRQYFAENYITVKYIRIGILDEDGEKLNQSNIEKQKELADTVLSLAQEEDANFDELMSTYNDDIIMKYSTEGMVISLLEASGGAKYLVPAFTDLKSGEIGGVYEGEDGFYIVLRMPVAASYFEANREYIMQSAIDWHFTTTLEEWLSEAKVTVGDIVKDVNLNNLREYIK